MDIADIIKSRPEEIRAALVERDHEKAHTLEDAFHLSALQAISSGELTHSQCVVLAAVAAETRLLPIERWAA